MSVPNVSTPYTTSEEIRSLLSDEGVDLRLNDSGVAPGDEPTVGELARETAAINYATSRVNMFLNTIYDMRTLEVSWQVREYATMFAVEWLCSRRGNPVPDSVREKVEKYEKELTALGNMEMVLGDATFLESSQPMLSNMCLDNRYHTRQLRLQRPISTNRPRRHPVNTYWPSQYAVEK